MKGKLFLVVIPLFMLITLGCEKETLNPLTDPRSGETAGYGGVLKKTDNGEYNVENIEDHKSNEVPECIILPDWPTAFFIMEEAIIRDDIITFVLSYQKDTGTPPPTS